MLLIAFCCISDAKAGRHEACGWPSMDYGSYGVSKIGVTLMARIHQEVIDQDTTKTDILVNAVSFLHHGYSNCVPQPRTGPQVIGYRAAE